MRRAVPLLALCAAAAGFGLAGCGADSAAPPTGTPPTTAPTTTPTTTAPTTTTVPVSTVSLRVYFLRDGRVAAATRDVPETKAVATAALAALVGGPDQQERTAGLSSAIPRNQTFRDLHVDGGVASVTLPVPGDLTREAQAQVVYTLTQFSTVDAVVIASSGELKRADFEAETPAILVESPTPGAEVSSPLRISGTANTFEATFIVELRLSSGAVAFRKVVNATSGSGTRGTFDVSIPFTGAPGPATLIAFEESAENGQPVHQVAIPLDVRP